MKGKHPLKSKTVGFNVLVLLALFLKEHFGVKLSENDLLLIATMGNLILRFITKEPITLGGKDGDTGSNIGGIVSS